MHRPTLRLVLACSVFAAGACAHGRAAEGPRALNTLTAAERGAGWRLLFDGKSFKGWRGLGYPGVPEGHWRIVDGSIQKIASGNVPRRPDGLPVRGGDLMTEETFGDFEFAWDWKVTPGANSGVKYNVSEELSTGVPETALRPATGAEGASHSAIGFEYQMIDDDRHPDGKLVKHKTGDLYDLISSNERKHVRPVGEWNESRIVFRGTHGEHWLNGEKVVEYELGTARMDSAIAASKYRPMAWFGTRRRGHIVLQDHGDEVYFRNIRIRELDGAKPAATR
jgi:hypothetical protein